MNPILYSHDEKHFTTNGIGILSDAISCIVDDEVNGKYELTLQYPIDGIHAAHILQRNIILAKPDPISRPQPFRIYKIRRIMRDTLTVNARHIVYDLAGISVMPFTGKNSQDTMAALRTYAITDCPFSFYAEENVSTEFPVSVPTAIWSLLGGSKDSILKVYGGEYEYDRWSVYLRKRRGTNRGEAIRYGKNLTTLEQDENCADCYTGVIPYWVDKDTKKCTMLPNKVVEAKGNFGYVKTLPLDVTNDFDKKPTNSQLIAAAEAYIEEKGVGIPVVSWKISFVDLEKSDEYRGLGFMNRIIVGDDIRIEFAQMGVSTSARVVSGKFDSVFERYETITLGSVQQTVADTIVKQIRSVSEIPSMGQFQTSMRHVVDTSIGISGGAMRLLDNNGDSMPDALYAADPAWPLVIWKIDHTGVSVSQSGMDGLFQMRLRFGSTGGLELYAQDPDSGNIVGYPVSWKTINGIPYLIGNAG